MEEQISVTEMLQTRQEFLGVPLAEPPRENKIRNTTIRQLNSGYVVEVGCHSFAFSTKEEMNEKLLGYINFPAETEERWFNNQSL